MSSKSTTPMTNEEREALSTAIKLYVEMGVLNRTCQSIDKFLARVPEITTYRLKTLINNHNTEIATMAEAKKVVYKEGGILPTF